jgi:hypothetical protein
VVKKIFPYSNLEEEGGGVHMTWLESILEKQYGEKEFASIYGFILYTDAHPYVKKVLRDDDFWSALDEISGDYWLIFSIRPEKGTFEYPDFQKDEVGLMIPIWKEPKENKKVLEEFGLQSTIDLPLFIAFAQDVDGEILKCTLRINDESYESAYDSIKKYVNIITDSIKKISPENRRNPLGTFAAVNYTLTEHEQWKKIKKGIKFVEWIKGWLS